MRLSLFLTTVLLSTAPACVSSTGGGATPTLNAATPATSQANSAFDEIAGSFPAINGVVLKDGEVIWSRQGGVQRDATDGVDRDYNFYSIAKMITGTAFYRLEKMGVVDLDTAVTRIDPDLGDAYAGVTLRHLLSHTAGVRHYRGESDWRAFNDRRCAAPSKAVEYFIDDPLMGTPGDEFAYSTFGFVLASHLLVKATGAATFDDAMRIALDDAYRFRIDRDGADKAANYLEVDGAFRPINLSAECKFGGGGLLGSALDLARFGAAVADGLVEAGDLRDWSADDRAAPEVLYGMTLGFSEEMQTPYALHSGGSPGGRGFLLVLFEPKIVVALTANSDGPHHADAAIAIARAFALDRE